MKLFCEACGKELRGGPLDHLMDEDKENCQVHPGPKYIPTHEGTWVLRRELYPSKS